MFQFYLALTFWLMIALLEAYGIFKLWEAIVRPRWINLVLLPGTIVAETAHFLAALLTGAPIRDAKLVSDEPVGRPASPDATKGIPVLSPLLISLLPILAGMAAIFVLYKTLDQSVVNRFATAGSQIARDTGQFGPGTSALEIELTQELTARPHDWFQMGRNMITLVQRLIRGLPGVDISHTWKSWLFIYLTCCLAVRMVPLRGNLRAGMAAVILVGGLAGLLGWMMVRVDKGLHSAWILVAYVIALTTLLLAGTLLIRGLIALGFALAGKPQPKRHA